MQQKAIGPHEGVELMLMQQGKKHIALFTDFIPADFVPYLHSTYHIKTLFVAQHEGFAYPSFVIYTPEYQKQAEELIQLLKPELLALDDTHRKIGRILGYEEWQIDAFLNQ